MYQTCVRHVYEPYEKCIRHVYEMYMTVYMYDTCVMHVLYIPYTSPLRSNTSQLHIWQTSYTHHTKGIIMV